MGTALGAAKCEVWFGSVSGIYISAEENYVLNNRNKILDRYTIQLGYLFSIFFTLI